MTTNAVTIAVGSSEMANNPAGEETRLTNDFLAAALEGTKENADNAKISELNAGSYAAQAQAVADNLPEQVDSYVEANMDRLHGKDGKDGPQGPQGIPGPVGPAGPTGSQGPAGQDGKDGAPGRDGQDGAPGKDGADGKDGKDGEIPADKLAQIDQNTQALNAELLQIQRLEQDKIDDVKINGTSIKNGTVVEIPVASINNFGAIKVGSGLYINSSSEILSVLWASESNINGRSSTTSIRPKELDYAVKCALCDGKGAAYTDTEKANARLRLGVAIVTLTQAEYDALEVKSADTTYLVTESD